MQPMRLFPSMVPPWSQALSGKREASQQVRKMCKAHLGRAQWLAMRNTTAHSTRLLSFHAPPQINCIVNRFDLRHGQKLISTWNLHGLSVYCQWTANGQSGHWPLPAQPHAVGDKKPTKEHATTQDPNLEDSIAPVMPLRWRGVTSTAVLLSALPTTLTSGLMMPWPLAVCQTWPRQSCAMMSAASRPDVSTSRMSHGTRTVSSRVTGGLWRRV